MILEPHRCEVGPDEGRHAEARLSAEDPGVVLGEFSALTSAIGPRSSCMISGPAPRALRPHAVLYM
ncbi:hypothetical protein OV079_02715 [Nannocystis pusilla]|uniref:Uncharacterized protein n=1 Tax=Nannocystis pusilla TaxID=889268 RepID=A0A9X3IW75_9BACT|nr:hypothetical protein [Nannocystis pusilla]MCY1004498.1 hypothetical protein [Nannocystis pusilla]